MNDEQFEGMPVTGYQVKIPAVTIESEDALRPGMILRLAVELRVQDVNFVESKKEGEEGLYTRVHRLGVETVEPVNAFDPQEDRSVLGGTAAGNATPDEHADDELGVPIRRTSDRWPADVAASPQADVGF